jgi:hypothetical protein
MASGEIQQGVPLLSLMPANPYPLYRVKGSIPMRFRQVTRYPFFTNFSWLVTYLLRTAIFLEAHPAGRIGPLCPVCLIAVSLLTQ